MMDTAHCGDIIHPSIHLSLHIPILQVIISKAHLEISLNKLLMSVLLPCTLRSWLPFKTPQSAEGMKNDLCTQAALEMLSLYVLILYLPPCCATMNLTFLPGSIITQPSGCRGDWQQATDTQPDVTENGFILSGVTLICFSVLPIEGTDKDDSSVYMFILLLLSPHQNHTQTHWD